MRIKMPHVTYIAQKIAIDLLKSGLVTLSSGVEPVAKIADEILRADLQKERALDERANEILDEKVDEFEAMQIDRKNMFWLIKRKLADSENFSLNYEERYSNLSYMILETIWKKNLVDYSVSENKVKNVIYMSIEDYLKNFEKIEDIVSEKIDNYKKKLIPGSEEYDMVFEKLYEEELRKKGMF